VRRKKSSTLGDSAIKENKVVCPPARPTEEPPSSDQKIEETAIVEIAKKHVTALTKLLAVPLPLVFAVMIALATTDDAVKIAGLEIPHKYAEYAVRTVVLLIFAQCGAHLLVLVAMARETTNSTTLRRSIAFHSGSFNPFFTIERSNKLLIPALLKVLLAPGLAGKLAVGSMIGFVQGFRVHFASGQVSHWYRIGSYIAWPFSKSLSEQWAQRSHEIVQYYIGPVTRWDFYADFLTLTTLFVSIGVISAIVYVTYCLWPQEEERAGFAAIQLGISGFAGWLIAILLSNAIDMKGATIIKWVG
jgi:hypothetical protein